MAPLRARGSGRRVHKWSADSVGHCRSLPESGAKQMHLGSQSFYGQSEEQAVHPGEFSIIFTADVSCADEITMMLCRTGISLCCIGVQSHARSFHIWGQWKI